MRLILRLGLLSCLAFGCGDDDTAPVDSGSGVDAATRDAGGSVDSGARDAASPDDGGTTGEDGGTTDAGGEECPDLAPTEPAAVVISQIDLATRRVELFNPRSEPLTFTTHQWCQRPRYGQVSTTGAVTIAPGAYAVHTLPDGWLGAGTATSGELAIYADSSYDSSGSIIDYVCWGTPPGASRRSTAEAAGIWSGDCAPAPTMGAIVRRPSTAGDGAASYDTTAAFEVTTCD